MSDLVGNPEDRFSCVAAHMSSRLQIQELAYNLEIENSQNKHHAKISELTVIEPHHEKTNNLHNYVKQRRKSASR